MRFFAVKLSLYVLLHLFFFTTCLTDDWESSYKDAAKRSLIPSVDLVLVPHEYSILDEKWLEIQKTTTYKRENLKRQVERYGGNWEKFLDAYKDRISINGDLIKIEMEGTTHFSNFNYDKKIPIVFYGPKYFKKGLYLDRIYQQHIVPTLAYILDSPLPNGAKLTPLRKITRKFFYESNIENDKSYSKSKPELIVSIVIDQGGIELYRSHPKSFPNIKKLMDKSAYFPKAEVGHIEAHTAVGHTAIGTGAFPKEHKVIANEKIFFEKGKDDKFYPKVQRIFEDEEENVEPQDMKKETLADVWDVYKNNKPIIISQCYAVRAAIGMAGHGSNHPLGDKDIVYWISKKDLEWRTAPIYYKLPSHTLKYNLGDYNRKNNLNPWWEQNQITTNKFFSKNFYKLVATPIQARLEGELFRETIESELIQTGLGKDGETDLAYLTLKATDAVGHTYGWESEEARLVFEETDRQIGLIWNLLEKEWGDDFIIVLTADHGAAPLREFSGGAYLQFDELISTIQSLLPESERQNHSLVHFYTTGMISLNKDTMKKFNISEYKIKETISGINVEGKPFFKRVYSRKDLE